MHWRNNMAKLSDILMADSRRAEKQRNLYEQLLEILKDDKDFEVCQVHDSIIIKTVYPKEE